MADSDTTDNEPVAEDPSSHSDLQDTPQMGVPVDEQGDKAGMDLDPSNPEGPGTLPPPTAEQMGESQIQTDERYIQEKIKSLEDHRKQTEQSRQRFEDATNALKDLDAQSQVTQAVEEKTNRGQSLASGGSLSSQDNKLGTEPNIFKSAYRDLIYGYAPHAHPVTGQQKKDLTWLQIALPIALVTLAAIAGKKMSRGHKGMANLPMAMAVSALKGYAEGNQQKAEEAHKMLKEEIAAQRQVAKDRIANLRQVIADKKFSLQQKMDIANQMAKMYRDDSMYDVTLRGDLGGALKVLHTHEEALKHTKKVTDKAVDTLGDLIKGDPARKAWKAKMYEEFKRDHPDKTPTEKDLLPYEQKTPFDSFDPKKRGESSLPAGEKTDYEKHLDEVYGGGQ